MKNIFYFCFLLILTDKCFAQFETGNHPIIFTNNSNYSEIPVCTAIITMGSEDSIKNIGNIRAFINYDSIGKNWDMPSEDEYIRFKSLHFYILVNDKSRNGQHWKEMYFREKNILNKTFNDYMDSRLKKQNTKISTEFTNTDYILNVYFIDKASNISRNNFSATYQFINVKSGNIVLQYYVEKKEYNSKIDTFLEIDDNDKSDQTSFSYLAIAMSNYLKKQLKN